MSLCARYNSTKVASLKIGSRAFRDREFLDKFRVLRKDREAILSGRDESLLECI